MFIAKSKNKNSFKMIDDLGKVDDTLFQSYDLFEAKQITPQQFTEVLKQQKINELKNQLASLGVDLNAIANSGLPAWQPELPDEVVAGSSTDKMQQLVPNNPNLHSTVKNPKDNETGVEKQIMSKVINKRTGQLFSMDQLQQEFTKFQEIIEREMPEVQYTVFNDDGFVLVTSQPLNNVPAVLPNGIPLKQQIG